MSRWTSWQERTACRRRTTSWRGSAPSSRASASGMSAGASTSCRMTWARTCRTRSSPRRSASGSGSSCGTTTRSSMITPTASAMRFSRRHRRTGYPLRRSSDIRPRTSTRCFLPRTISGGSRQRGRGLVGGEQLLLAGAHVAQPHLAFLQLLLADEQHVGDAHRGCIFEALADAAGELLDVRADALRAELREDGQRLVLRLDGNHVDLHHALRELPSGQPERVGDDLEPEGDAGRRMLPSAEELANHPVVSSSSGHRRGDLAVTEECLEHRPGVVREAAGKGRLELDLDAQQGAEPQELLNLSETLPALVVPHQRPELREGLLVRGLARERREQGIAAGNAQSRQLLLHLGRADLLQLVQAEDCLGELLPDAARREHAVEQLPVVDFQRHGKLQLAEPRLGGGEQLRVGEHTLHPDDIAVALPELAIPAELDGTVAEHGTHLVALEGHLELGIHPDEARERNREVVAQPELPVALVLEPEGLFQDLRASGVFRGKGLPALQHRGLERVEAELLEGSLQRGLHVHAQDFLLRR